MPKKKINRPQRVFSYQKHPNKLPVKLVDVAGTEYLYPASNVRKKKKES